MLGDNLFQKMGKNKYGYRFRGIFSNRAKVIDAKDKLRIQNITNQIVMFTIFISSISTPIISRNATLGFMVFGVAMFLCYIYAKLSINNIIRGKDEVTIEKASDLRTFYSSYVNQMPCKNIVVMFLVSILFCLISVISITMRPPDQAIGTIAVIYFVVTLVTTLWFFLMLLFKTIKMNERK